MDATEGQSAAAISKEGLPPLELKAAQEATLALLMAVKNYSLFPPEHVSTINLLNTLAATLVSFLQKYGPLRLHFEKSCVRYEEEVVFEEANPDNNPAFIFYRDGILWLEFSPGLKVHELLAFFRIVSRYKLNQEEPEGDLVTELWGSDFNSINYQASDSLWEAEPILEFSLLNPNAQAVLEYGAANLAGFDLLQSVLGAQNFGPGDGVASTGGVGSGGAKGEGDGLGPGLGPGEGTGGVDAPPPRDMSGEATAAEGARGPGGLSPGGRGEGGVSGTTVNSQTPRPLAKEEPDNLDFWETLRRVSPAGQGLGGTGQADSAGFVYGFGASAEKGTREGNPAGPGGYGGEQVQIAGGHGASARGQGGNAKSRRRVDHAAQNIPAGGAGAASSAIAARKATVFSQPDRGGDWREGEEKEESYISVNVASIEPGHSLWQFSVTEQQELAEMVREYEEGDNNSNIVDLLLILLGLEDEPQIFTAMLAFLQEEFRLTLSNRRFDIGQQLLAKINELIRDLPPEKGWAQPLLAQFFEDIVAPEILDSLTPLWPELPVQKVEVLQDLSSILRLLPARAGVALVPTLAQVGSGIGRRILIDMIAVFVVRELALIEEMLNRPEEDLLLRLLQVLEDSPPDRLTEELLVKALKHPKEKVRLQALALLITRDSERYSRIFQLIHDSSAAIRGAAFHYLGRERNQEVETMFLNHMTSEGFLGESPEHIASCYLALGLCGSDASLSHLKKVLYGQPWNFLVGIGTGVHRQGAAIALSKLRTKASRKLLAEAEFSGVPHIRNAWFKVAGN